MLKIDTERLTFLIEGRRDIQGKESYTLSVANIRLHLHSMDSVLDVINSNSIGYVEDK